jgi:hypothetical protein
VELTAKTNVPCKVVPLLYKQYVTMFSDCVSVCAQETMLDYDVIGNVKCGFSFAVILPFQTAKAKGKPEVCVCVCVCVFMCMCCLRACANMHCTVSTSPQEHSSLAFLIN